MKMVLRCAGRIDAATVSEDMKRPVTLPRKSHITGLIISYYHVKYLHHNFETVINKIRQKFIISKLRVELIYVVKNCQKCKIQKVASVPRLMGSLPKARLMSYTRTFTYMGIDYWFGPMIITIGRSEVTRWGAIVTYLTSRAVVYTETCSSLSTDACNMVIRTIFARRGTPLQIYSENGTNFKGASAELKKVIEEIENDKMSKEFTPTNPEWIFNPTALPHMGDW